METLIRAEGLTKKFTDDSSAAVNGVSFCLQEGETLGLVGESGSGKSTLAKLLVGLAEPTEGEIWISGEKITGAGEKKMREIYRLIQMVFQSPAGSFDPRKTIGYGISESLRNKKMNKAERMQRVGELLVRCGLPEELAGRYPHELSGGQCQRAAIARALAVRPKILICDEATSSLDVTVQHQIMELLKKLRKDWHLSVLFICHNLALVQTFCDRILVMHDGRIVEEGNTDQVIRAPQSPYTKLLIDAAF